MEEKLTYMNTYAGKRLCGYGKKVDFKRRYSKSQDDGVRRYQQRYQHETNERCWKLLVLSEITGRHNVLHRLVKVAQGAASAASFLYNSEKDSLAVKSPRQAYNHEFTATPILNDKGIVMQVLRLMALPLFALSLSVST